MLQYKPCIFQRLQSKISIILCVLTVQTQHPLDNMNRDYSKRVLYLFILVAKCMIFACFHKNLDSYFSYKASPPCYHCIFFAWNNIQSLLVNYTLYVYIVQFSFFLILAVYISLFMRLSKLIVLAWTYTISSHFHLINCILKVHIAHFSCISDGKFRFVLLHKAPSLYHLLHLVNTESH